MVNYNPSVSLKKQLNEVECENSVFKVLSYYACYSFKSNMLSFNEKY
jgi:hypothetical protein